MRLLPLRFRPERSCRLSQAKIAILPQSLRAPQGALVSGGGLLHEFLIQEVPKADRDALRLCWACNRLVGGRRA